VKHTSERGEERKFIFNATPTTPKFDTQQQQQQQHIFLVPLKHFLSLKQLFFFSAQTRNFIPTKNLVSERTFLLTFSLCESEN
jgi:hypothetical protein